MALFRHNQYVLIRLNFQTRMWYRILQLLQQYFEVKPTLSSIIQPVALHKYHQPSLFSSHQTTIEKKNREIKTPSTTSSIVLARRLSYIFIRILKSNTREKTKWKGMHEGSRDCEARPRTKVGRSDSISPQHEYQILREQTSRFSGHLNRKIGQMVH